MTRVRVKGALQFTDDGICKAQCYWCGESVPIPVSLANVPEDPEMSFTMRSGTPQR